VIGIRDKIGVHVHPKFEFVSNRTERSYKPEHSDEYSQLLSAVRRSPYYQHNASKACVFIPPIDTLSQSKLDLGLTSTLLNSLPEYVNTVLSCLIPSPCIGMGLHSLVCSSWFCILCLVLIPTDCDIHCACMYNGVLSLPQLIVYHDIRREYENEELSKPSILTLQSMR